MITNVSLSQPSRYRNKAKSLTIKPFIIHLTPNRKIIIVDHRIIVVFKTNLTLKVEYGKHF